MAIMKEPIGTKAPWPPPPNKRHSPYTVLPGESFESIGKKLAIDPWDLIHFNFETYKPEEVNWHLSHDLHCDKQTRDGKNFMFRGGEIIYLPPDDSCPTPAENYPYSEKTFQMVRRIAPLVRKYSSRYGVPAVAVAGSIADEYNTRTGPRAAVDWYQDNAMFEVGPSSFVNLEILISNAFWDWILAGQLGHLSAVRKLEKLKPTKQDLGIGNIKLETAKSIYNSNRTKFKQKNMNHADVARYLSTDEGTVHVAALVIQKAKRLFHNDLEGYSPAKKEAVYVTYYKQGDSYWQRFQDSKAADPAKNIEPGEGCRVLLQRDRFLKELHAKANP